MSQQIEAITFVTRRAARAGLCGQSRRLVVAHGRGASRAAAIDRLVPVIHPDDQDLALAHGGTKVDGGSDRGASVRAGLAVDAPPQEVRIEASARPPAGRDVSAGSPAGLETDRAAAPGLSVVAARARGQVLNSLPRTPPLYTQTPQGLDFGAILPPHRSHARGAADGVKIAAKARPAVAIPRGCDDTPKLTFRADCDRAERVF